jgi:hypothetical protein
MAPLYDVYFGFRRATRGVGRSLITGYHGGTVLSCYITSRRLIWVLFCRYFLFLHTPNFYFFIFIFYFILHTVSGRSAKIPGRPAHSIPSSYSSIKVTEVAGSIDSFITPSHELVVQNPAITGAARLGV